jgi:hypothetical protein
MSAIPMASAQPSDVTEDVRPAAATAGPSLASQAPILITEQEVAFGTAAAIPVSPERTIRRWVMAVRELFVSAGDPYRRGRPIHPRRYGYLEAGCMAREMDRL